MQHGQHTPWHIRSTDSARCHRTFGFDHGVGHPLLLLYDARAPNCQKNKAFKELGHYSEWPKVADAVIQAEHSFNVTLSRYACARKSNGGAKGLCVPPARVRVLGSEASNRAGCTVWSTRVI